MTRYFITIACLFGYLLLALLPMAIISEALHVNVEPLAFLFTLSLPVFALPILLSKERQLRQTTILTIVTFAVGYPLVLVGVGYFLLLVGWIIALVIATTGEGSKSVQFPAPPSLPPPTPGSELVEMHDGTFKRAVQLKPGNLLKGPGGAKLRYEAKS